jgi:TRAP-type C4-dicarboxylate transport system substrate-binding protein
MTQSWRIARRVGLALGLAGLLAAGLALLPAGETAAQAPVSWRLFLYNPAPHPFARTMMQWADEVRARTGGRLEIKVFPAGELPYRVNQAASIVGNRLVEMSDANGTFLEGEMPLPADVQSVVRETGARYGQSMLEQSYRLEAESGDVMRKAGFTFVDPTPEDARTMETRLGEFALQWAKRTGTEAEEALGRMREAVR